jgi:hypothetical protein
MTRDAVPASEVAWCGGNSHSMIIRWKTITENREDPGQAHSEGQIGRYRLVRCAQLNASLTPAGHSIGPKRPPKRGRQRPVRNGETGMTGQVIGCRPSC